MRFTFTKSIGFGRLDGLVALFSDLVESAAGSVEVHWERVESIAPAGFAILACLYDTAVEQGRRLTHHGMARRFRDIPVVRNLLALSNARNLPRPDIHDQERVDSLLVGRMSSIDPFFPDRVDERFGHLMDEALQFSVRLILNELMQNAVDHANAERYYVYAGVWPTSGRGNEIHVGVLDMGVTIPAKLETKYARPNSDRSYLELAQKKGVTTRRQRPGGFGLFYALEELRDTGGQLTLVSRNAQLTHYLRHRTIQHRELTRRLRGTWCMARFPATRRAT